MLTCGIIYYILYYILYILYYTLLSSYSSLLLSSPFLLFPIFHSHLPSISPVSPFPSHPLIFLFPHLSSSSFPSPPYSSITSILIQSIRVGSYITLFIFHPASDNSTPHVLSEWMVEVCRFHKYRYLRFGVCWWVLV